MMLLDLLKGQEKSQLVLLTDEANCVGRHLLLNWILGLGKRCTKLILVCSERPPQYFQDSLPSDIQQKLICVNGNLAASHQSSDKSDVFNSVISGVKSGDGDAAVVVDSLTLHMISTSVAHTCSSLHKLAIDKGVVQVVALLHRDVHDTHTCALVQHVATTTVDLQPTTGNRHNCHIRHCRMTGKVFKTRESFSFDENFHIHSVGPTPTHDPRSQALPTPQNDPTVDLPFNLSLNQQEREARSQVKLPYLKDDAGDIEQDLTQSTGGKIIYEPDDADDFDEEDPDDDLNI